MTNYLKYYIHSLTLICPHAFCIIYNSFNLQFLSEW